MRDLIPVSDFGCQVVARYNSLVEQSEKSVGTDMSLDGIERMIKTSEKMASNRRDLEYNIECLKVQNTHQAGIIEQHTLVYDKLSVLWSNNGALNSANEQLSIDIKRREDTEMSLNQSIDIRK